MAKSTEWSDANEESDDGEDVDSEEEETSDDDDDDDEEEESDDDDYTVDSEDGDEESEEEEESSDDEGAVTDSEDEESERFGDEEDIETGTTRDAPKATSDDTNNTTAAVVCCCCLILIIAIVLGVTLGGKEDVMPTPAPVIQTSSPTKKISPMPSSSRSNNPSARPTATPSISMSPTKLIPETLLIFAEADTFIADDSMDPEVARFRGQNETSLLVQQGMNTATGISNSYVLISFDISKIPDPENIFERTKTTHLKLRHIASGPENNPVNITIVRLPSTPFQIESLHAGLFTPSGGVDGPQIAVAPSDMVLDIDITDLIFGQHPFVRSTQETQLFLMLKASSQNPEGDRFYSRESTQGKPELIVGLEEVSSSPSVSLSPTMTASPTSSSPPSVLPTSSSPSSMLPSSSLQPSITNSTAGEDDTGDTVISQVDLEDSLSGAMLRYSVIGDFISIELTVPAIGWVGFGYSTDGSMLGSLAVIGLPDEGTVFQSSLDVKDVSGINKLESQTLTETSITQSGSETTLKFTKPLSETGAVSIDVAGTNTFLTAWGSSNTLGFHSNFGNFQLNFADGGVPDADGGDTAAEGDTG